jgi:hypothetical protein
MQNAAFVFPTSESINAAKKEAKKTAPRAPRKTAKKDETAQAQTAKLETIARDFAKEFNAALVARNAIVKSNDTETAANNTLRDASAFNACFNKPEFKEVFDGMLRNVAIANRIDNKTDFVAVKTLVKIVSTARAIGQGIKRELDGYTLTIGENLCALGDLRIKDGLVSLSRSVEYDELEQSKALVRRMNCSVGTAGAQSGSTRMTLRELKIAQVVKGKRDDQMFIEPDNARSKAFVALFA